MKKFLLAGAAIAALATGAQAADLGSPRGPIAAAVVAPVFNWSGVFVGAQIGYGWGRTAVAANTLADSGSYSTNGVTGGVHLGYNWQINNIVLGLVTDIEASSLRGSARATNVDYFTRLNWQGSTRARLGVAVDRVHVYATGGVAYAGLDYRAINIGAPVGVSASGARFGWTVGAGVEYAITPNWVASLEYRYTDFGRRNVNYAGSPVTAITNASFKTTTHTVRLGVSYLFSTGPSAIVARY
ncbi:MAG: porin family protein [Phreatobacter sp.]|uniref:outer membrane protein n=1 Tax=Phreatobacter sp. TaxID=1966341 RepID=UPI001A442EF3|nr:outer membrane protein [Phreatobacter sp.]MBL8567834.1 porin family protein [Phreatobacter sp.]